jgi:hypothetical protein
MNRPGPSIRVRAVNNPRWRWLDRRTGGKGATASASLHTAPSERSFCSAGEQRRAPNPRSWRCWSPRLSLLLAASRLLLHRLACSRIAMSVQWDSCKQLMPGCGCRDRLTPSFKGSPMPARSPMKQRQRSRFSWSAMGCGRHRG